jgi:DNA-binding helix-turn-helix protein
VLRFNRPNKGTKGGGEVVSKNLLRSRIAQNALTQKQLAELIGISPNSFSSKINGKKPFNTDEIDKICAVLHISNNIEKAKIFL